MNKAPKHAGVDLPAELLADQKALDDAVAKAKRTRAAVDETAAQIPALDAQVQELTAKLAEKDADRAIAEDVDVKGLDAEVNRLGADLDSTQRGLNRARNALKVHEERAPALDEEVRAAVVVLENDLLTFSGDLTERLRAEILERCKPLQGAFAALRALGPLGGVGVRDVIDAAYIPDPRGFVRMQGGTGVGSINCGTNLLAGEPEPEHAELAKAITQALAPVRASLVAGKALGSYVPLDKRPKPYVRKGWSSQGVTGERRAAAEQSTAHASSAQSQLPQAAQGGPAAQPQASGFQRKHHADGTPIDGDMGRQMVDNMMRGRGEGGSEFAV